MRLADWYPFFVMVSIALSVVAIVLASVLPRVAGLKGSTGPQGSTGIVGLLPVSIGGTNNPGPLVGGNFMISTNDSIIEGQSTTNPAFQSVTFPLSQPLDSYQETVLLLEFRDSTGAVITAINGTSFDHKLVKVGKQVTMWMSDVTFNDAAVIPTNTIVSTTAIPLDYRPSRPFSVLTRTYNGVNRQAGVGSIRLDGKIEYRVDASSSSGLAWPTANGQINGSSFSWTLN